MRAALAALCSGASLSLQGCGGKLGPNKPGPGPGPGPPGPGPNSTYSCPDTNYDGSPPFFLEDVGMKSFSYAPDYLKKQSCLFSPGGADCMHIYNDDFAAEWGEKFWGPKGRNDIATMAKWGANAVRLYGNDPRLGKCEFLDQLLAQKMKALTGLSMYIFDEANPGCLRTGGDCYEKTKEMYKQILSTGQFAKGGFYHNAIESVSLMNEPEQRGRSGLPLLKGLVTALDGLLSAEAEAGIKPWSGGRWPHITVTWSGATYCPAVAGVTGAECNAGVGGMVSMFRIVQTPSLVGYKPRNDIWKAFQARWINSFNTFAQEGDIYASSIGPATTMSMKGYKIYIGEWTCYPKTPITTGCSPEQVGLNLDKMKNDPKYKDLIGVSYFAFQQPYDQPGFDSSFGVLKLRKEHPWNTSYILEDSAVNHPINCLEVKYPDIAPVLAKVWGGEVPELPCPTGDGRAEVVV